MFRFYIDTEHVTDEAKNLAAVTVKWSEDDEEASQQIMGLLHLIVAAFFIVLFLMMGEPPILDLLKMIAAGLAAAAVLIMLFGHHVCTGHYSMTFAADGPVTMPRGMIMNRLRGPDYFGEQQEISSIQIQAAERREEDRHKEPRYEVWVYWEDGRNYSLAASLFKPQAHRLAVELERALSAIRDARAQHAMFAGHAWAEAVID